MTAIDKMTLGQFQEIYKTQKSDLDPEDKMTEMVAIMTGQTAQQVEAMALPAFNTAARAVADFLSRPLPEEKPQPQLAGWHICYEPGKLTRGQYVTLMHFMNGDSVENAHLIMASLATDKNGKHPADQHAEIAEAMQDVAFSQIYPACVFFCDLFAASMTSLKSYLARQLTRSGMMTKKQSSEYLTALLSDLAGSITPNASPTSKASASTKDSVATPSAS